MKTADGKVVERKADGKIVESSSISTSSTNASIKRSSSRSNTKYDKTSSATTTTTHKMRPTQLLVSKNEGNTISSWIRDICVILIPMYIMYMLATHPLIKDIGQPHNRKLTKSELVKKMLYEQHQKLEYENAIYKYNFMTAVVDGGKRCYEFPSMEVTSSSWKPPALFRNRYKGFLGNKKDEKKDRRPQGVISKARRNWGPHAWKAKQRQQQEQKEDKKEKQVVKRQGVVANARKRWLHS